jgi:hypothetical protein
LSFNIELLKDKHGIAHLLNTSNGKKPYHSLINIKEHINPTLLDFLAELHIFPTHCEMFYSPPNFFSNIHVDVRHGDSTKINWAFGGKNSLMNWYRPKDNIIRDTQNLSAIESKYIGYDRHEVDLLFSAPIGLPSVVQVGVPHNVVNPTEDRYCISLVVSSVDKDNQRYRPTMQETINMLSKYLIPV